MRKLATNVAPRARHVSVAAGETKQGDSEDHFRFCVLYAIKRFLLNCQDLIVKQKCRKVELRGFLYLRTAASRRAAVMI